MVDAGRILIMPKGIWSNLTSYDMLDLVTQDGIAYLARQANVGQSPKLDSTYQYWQPFGSAQVPDSETIILNANNELAVNIDNRSLKYDSTNDYLKVSIDGTTIKYDSTNGYLYADVAANLNDLGDVTIALPANGQILAYDGTTNKWKNITDPNTAKIGTLSNLTTTVKTDLVSAINEVDIKDTVTSKEVTTSSWTQDTTSQSGTTLYKKQISLSHVYANPSVDIGAASGSVLPTTAEQDAYDLVEYVTVDTTVPCMYLYASNIPTTAFYINVEGVD